MSRSSTKTRSPRGFTGRIDPKQAQVSIGEIAHAVKSAWASACKWDDIDPNASFVVFSEANPFVPFHAAAMSQYMEALHAYQAGGYVGLRLA